MTLELSLQVIFVIVDDTLIGNRDEYLLSLGIGQIVDPVKYVVVQSKSPLQF